ncbi:MAG TPA: GntR family transcriptional regulator, partial [Microlunatus sp.]|nr:GntR family transcriptional regulator [Microlunatus sp.]
MRPPKIATRVAHQLAELIDRGRFPPGSRLPGERDLARRFLVSRSTIRAALAALEGAGRVSRSAQRGWFVPSPTVGEPPSTLQSFTEMAAQRGLTATATVLEQIRRPVTLEEARRLRIPPGAEALALTRLRGMDTTPICVDRNLI